MTIALNSFSDLDHEAFAGACNLPNGQPPMIVYVGPEDCGMAVIVSGQEDGEGYTVAAESCNTAEAGLMAQQDKRTFNEAASLALQVAEQLDKYSTEKGHYQVLRNNGFKKFLHVRS